MEDAAEALLMAGNVLIFLIALTVCISSFSTLRAGIDNILEQTETVQMVQDSGEYINFIQSRNNGAVRVVGAETVISSMYRAVKEDYVIYIKLNNLGNIESGEHNVEISTATKDLQVNDENGNPKTLITAGERSLIKVTIHENDNVNEIVRYKIYDKIKSSRFYEYLGEYQEGSSDVSSENKLTKRVITYIETTQ